VRARAQAGLAAVTALLVVAVSAAAAAVMLSQQSAMLGQVSMVASRAQADAYAQAGLDWARGVLAEDSRKAPTVDSLDEGWAMPIAGLPVERALVSGAIADAQGRFNLNNLVVGGKASQADVDIFRRLLASQGASPDLADAVVDWIDPDSEIAGFGGAEDSFYLSLPKPYRAANQPMQQADELYLVHGFDPKLVARLRPLVTALPARTAINANTAPEAVLAAMFPDVPAAKIATFAARRRTQPAKSREEAASLLGIALAPAGLEVKSAFFEITVAVAQDDVQLATDALVRRADNGASAIIWRRPRF
jgi:general secretion pathway protein K